MLFVSSFAENIQDKYESVTPAKTESPVYMKFKMQILTTLIASFFLIFAWSRYTLRGKVEERKNTIEETEHEFSNIMENPVISWAPKSKEPLFDPITNIQTQASVIGNVNDGASVMVPPISSLRSNKMTSISVGNESNVKDVFYSLETIDEDCEPIEKSLASISNENSALYMGEKVSPVQHFQIHNPACEGSDKFTGMQAFVFKAKVGNDCAIDPQISAIGVTSPDSKYRSSDAVITSQRKTDKLPDTPEDCQYDSIKKPK